MCVCVFPVYDAFGKMGSNVEGGNANQPGSLQQCRSARGPTFSGKYCQVFIWQVETNVMCMYVIICHPGSWFLGDKKETVQYFYYHREQSSTLSVSVFLTPVVNRMWKCWRCLVSGFKISFLRVHCN